MFSKAGLGLGEVNGANFGGQALYMGTKTNTPEHGVSVRRSSGTSGVDIQGE